MGSVGLFLYESAASISKTFSILLAMIINILVFLNCPWKSENYTFIKWENKASAPCMLASKLETYFF
jgi:hypothetical protein